MAIETAAAATSTLTRPIMLRVLPELERRTHGEVELAELVPLLWIWVDTVVYANRAEGRVPAEARAYCVLEVREVDLRPDGFVRTVDVAHIEEEREPYTPEGRDRVLQ